MSVDPALLSIWARGWALTRKVDPPVCDRQALRIEVCQPDQVRRFVYADVCYDLVRRAADITEPFVLLKVCADADDVRSLLVPDWDVRQTGVVMVTDDPMPLVIEADEPFRPERWSEGSVRFVRLVDQAGEEVARGRAVRVEDRVIYDRIAVYAGHRRRGFGGRIMRALQTEHEGWGRGVLVATDEGASLYATLGWRTVSPYTTAVRL